MLLSLKKKVTMILDSIYFNVDHKFIIARFLKIINYIRNETQRRVQLLENDQLPCGVM